MVKVTIERALAEELIDARIKTLNDSLYNVLEEHGYSDAGKFLSDVHFGEVPDAEVDAQNVRKWLDRISFLESLRKSWDELYDDDEETVVNSEYFEDELIDDGYLDIDEFDPIMDDDFIDEDLDFIVDDDDFPDDVVGDEIDDDLD